MTTLSKETSALDLGVATFGYLYRKTLQQSLRSIHDAGFHLIELMAAPPHLYAPTTGADEARAIRRYLRLLELRCVALNASELNLISPNQALRDTAESQYIQLIRLAHDLEVDLVVVVPGRLNPLIPMPLNDAISILHVQLESLLTYARQLGVRLALETSPYGFLQRASEVLDVVDRFNDAYLGIAVDCSNVVPKESPTEAVAEAGVKLLIAHVSDTTPQVFAHTSIGKGTIDFGEYAKALRQARFSGPTVYELVDGEDPDLTLAADLKALRGFGWSA
jgi:sugar phosphate isomerase/epimerase